MRLAELVAKYEVPGAGVLSAHTRVEVTSDSVFKVGSITRIWTPSG